MSQSPKTPNPFDPTEQKQIDQMVNEGSPDPKPDQHDPKPPAKQPEEHKDEPHFWLP